MPIYEFVCQNCRKRVSLLVRDVSAPFAPKCLSCGNTNLSRVSGFAYHKSLKTVWEESDEPTMHPGDDYYYKDPRNIGRWVEKKFQNMGQQLPSQIQKKIQAAREGVLPEPLKDLGSASPISAYD